MDNRSSNSYNSLRPQSYNAFPTTSTKTTSLNPLTSSQQKTYITDYNNRGGYSTSQSKNMNDFIDDSLKYGNPVNVSNFTTASKLQQSSTLQGSGDLGTVYRGGQNFNSGFMNQQGSRQDNYSVKTNSNISSQNYGVSQEAKSKDQNNLSWTKYISMEFKTQQMQKLVDDQRKQIQQKLKKISELEKNLSIAKWQGSKSLKQMQNKYQQQIRNQKYKYQSQLQSRTKQVKNLMQKLTDRTKQSISQDIKAYFNQMLQKSQNSSVNLSALTQQHCTLSQKLVQYESHLQQNQQTIQKQGETILKLTTALQEVNQRLLTRVTPCNDTTSFLKILETQALQIQELRDSFNTIQGEYIRSRAMSVDLENKLKAYESETSIANKKVRLQYNNTISQLSFKITQKQNECSFLSRRLKSVQTRLKQALEQNNVKGHLIQSLQLKYRNTELQEKVRQLIESFMVRVTQCIQCEQKEQQLKELRQKVSFLQN